jgi:hypothetical protein
MKNKRIKIELSIFEKPRNIYKIFKDKNNTNFFYTYSYGLLLIYFKIKHNMIIS